MFYCDYKEKQSRPQVYRLSIEHAVSIMQMKYNFKACTTFCTICTAISVHIAGESWFKVLVQVKLWLSLNNREKDLGVRGR